MEQLLKKMTGATDPGALDAVLDSMPEPPEPSAEPQASMSAQKFSLGLGAAQSFHFEMIGNKKTNAGKVPKLVNSYDVPIITKVLSSEELLQLWGTNVLI